MNRFLNYILSSVFCVGSFIGFSQVVPISNGIVTSCSGSIIDTGLSNNDYDPNEDYTMTLCSGDEGPINLFFFGFSLGDGDMMSLYDGSSVNAPLIGIYTNQTLQGSTIISTNSCITIHWTSDQSDQGNFIIFLSCETPCIDPIPVVESEGGLIQGCLNEEISFDAANSETFNNTTVSSFLWDFGDGMIDTTSWPIANHVYEQSGLYSVGLSITDSNGCTSSTSIDLSVLIAPEPVYNINIESPLCIGTTLNYEIQGNFTPAQWDATFSSNLNGPNLIPDNQGQNLSNSLTVAGFNPSETIEDPNDLAFLFVNIEHSKIGDLVIELECPNGQTLVTQQQGGNTMVGNPIDNDLTPNEIGVGLDYWWTPTSTNGMWNEFIGASIPSGTYASVEPWSNLVGCPINGLWTIHLSDNMTLNNGYLFDWSIGFDPNVLGLTPSIGLDADSSYWNTDPTITETSSDGNELTLSYSQAGNYTYTYHLLDNFGCTYSSTYEIEVLQGPIAEAGPDLVLCSENGSLQGQIIPSASPFDAYTYEWNTSNNLSDSTSLTPMVEGLENTTTYYLSTSSVGNTQCTTTDSVTVSVIATPNAGNDTDITFCPSGNEVNLFNLIEGNPDEGGVWINADGNEVSSIFDPSTSESTVINYSFISCDISTEINITVEQLDFVLSNDTTICQGGTATLIADVTTVNNNNIVYTWSDNFPNTNEIIVSPTTTTSYSVSLGYGNGCTTDQQTCEVSYYAPINSGITPDSYICPNEGLLLEAINPTGGFGSYVYQWAIGDTLVGTENNYTSTTAVDASYCVTITDQCESTPFTSCTNVFLESSLDPSFSYSNVLGCYPIASNFEALETNSNEVQYESWSFGDNSTPVNQVSTTTHEYLAPGEYTVIHTLTSLNECVFTSVEPLLVHAYPYPEASFYTNSGVSILPNTSFQFTNTSEDNETNTWVFYTELGEVLGTSNEENPNFIFPSDEVGNYFATLTIANEYGCSSTISSTLAVDGFNFFIPTAITANNDGVNDNFYIQGQNIDVDRFKLTISNRWGEVVFQTNNINEKWDGRNNLLTTETVDNFYTQNDTYTYTVEITYPGNPEIQQIQGIITVIR